MGSFIVILLAFAGTCAAIASAKNRSTIGWFFLGILFSVFALIVIACIPALPAPEEAAIN